MESLLFSGSAIEVDQNPIYGYTTEPQRNTVSGGDWGTIANVYANVLSAVTANQADNYFGPYGLYVALAQYHEMLAFYDDGSSDRAIDRVLKLPGLEFVKPATQLADEAVLVTFQGDVVDLAVAQDIVPVQWETMGGLVQWFKIMAALVPRVKHDADNRSGVCHISGI
jgi:uncharacterized linocin/CFP29 family protein